MRRGGRGGPSGPGPAQLGACTNVHEDGLTRAALPKTDGRQAPGQTAGVAGTPAGVVNAVSPPSRRPRACFAGVFEKCAPAAVPRARLRGRRGRGASWGGCGTRAARVGHTPAGAARRRGAVWSGRAAALWGREAFTRCARGSPSEQSPPSVAEAGAAAAPRTVIKAREGGGGGGGGATGGGGGPRALGAATGGREGARGAGNGGGAQAATPGVSSTWDKATGGPGNRERVREGRARAGSGGRGRGRRGAARAVAAVASLVPGLSKGPWFFGGYAVRPQGMRVCWVGSVGIGP
jgi:DNA polymerase-3 subunit gamma/tau